MNDSLFKIAMSLMPIIGAIITGYLIPWLKAKVGSENLNQYMMWAKCAVQCAEMIYKESGEGKKKKQYVIEYLSSVLPELSPEQLEVLIEAAVKELKLAEQEVKNG